MATSPTFLLPIATTLSWPLGFVAILTEPPRRGGEAGFSCVLLALAFVGRIMRAKKPSSAPPLVEVRDSGRFAGAVFGANEARDEIFRAGIAVFGAGRMVVDGLRTNFWAAAASSPCFAAEAAVGAVRCEGKRTGRVGDFGFGFLKPPRDAVPVLSL